MFICILVIYICMFELFILVHIHVCAFVVFSFIFRCLLPYSYWWILYLFNYSSYVDVQWINKSSVKKKKDSLFLWPEPATMAKEGSTQIVKFHYPQDRVLVQTLFGIFWKKNGHMSLKSTPENRWNHGNHGNTYLLQEHHFANDVRYIAYICVDYIL